MTNLSSITSWQDGDPYGPTHFNAKFDSLISNIDALNNVAVYPIDPVADYGAVGDDATDDTTALNNCFAANTRDAVIDGHGRTYRISGRLVIPTGSTRVTLKNIVIRQMSDSTILESTTTAGNVTFFTLDRALLIAASHTTGRPVIDFTAFSLSRFRDVWIVGTTNKSVAFYGIGSPTGSSPYHNVFEKCYTGANQYGWLSADNGTPATGVNNNTLLTCRFQPSSGNTAIKMSEHAQAIAMIACVVESTGGAGVECDATACYIQGTRLEALDTGIALGSHATACVVLGNYYSGVTTKISYAGSSRTANMILGDGPAGVQNMFWPGPIEAFAFRSRVTTVTASYSATTLDSTVLVNSSSTATVTLPVSSSCTGQRFDVKRMGAQTVMIAATSGSSFDSNASLAIDSQFSGYAVQSYGSGYAVIGRG